MSYRRACAFSTLAVVARAGLRADGQSVISTRSGEVHLLEGAIYFSDQSRNCDGGRPRGGIAYAWRVLRMGEKSEIRMVANELSDTRVELPVASANVDSAEPSSI
jgi:hypothetical protein